MSEQPRPAGTHWWCSLCGALVQAVIVHKDTVEHLIDEAHCPDPEAKHGELTTLIGTVATERLDRKELAASVTLAIHAVLRDGLEQRVLPLGVVPPG